MSPALPPGPVSHFSRSLQCAPTPTCLFNSLWRHSCQASLQHLRRCIADFAHSAAYPDTFPAAIPGSSPDLRCLNFHNPKLVPRI